MGSASPSSENVKCSLSSRNLPDSNRSVVRDCPEPRTAGDAATPFAIPVTARNAGTTFAITARIQSALAPEKISGCGLQRLSHVPVSAGLPRRGGEISIIVARTECAGREPRPLKAIDTWGIQWLTRRFVHGIQRILAIRTGSIHGFSTDASPEHEFEHASHQGSCRSKCAYASHGWKRGCASSPNLCFIP
jgi:hypothetical protein